ncbi:MAG TPA: hypothetical protein VLL54_00490 [Pyrinomonadaceae bacterium]|nr:hypothetical protein [Pyrinomonadaceae bacterium]
MRFLFEIYLRTWEWFQDRRAGKVTSTMPEKAERKRIWTFVSQGAVGGAIGYFFLLVCYVVTHPSALNPLYLALVPFILLFGAVLGCLPAFFIWLAELIFKSRAGLFSRALLVVGASVLESVLLSIYMENMRVEDQSVQLTLVITCAAYLPLVLLTGSSIRPGHLIFLGAGPHGPTYNFGSWLSYPAGFVLRVVSLFGLFEAIMALAIWASARSTDWSGEPGSEYAGSVVLLFCYFALSSYVSVKTPRKIFLGPTAILVNLPLAVFVFWLMQLGKTETTYFAYVLMSVIALWTLYTLGRLIAPEPVCRAVWWPENAPQQTLSQSRTLQVSL